MPRLDGFEVAAMIRSEFADGPHVIAMTGDATQEVVDELLTSGFDGYLTKPFRIEKLECTIKEFHALGVGDSR